MACASAGNCSAVGYYADSSGRGQVLLLTETSGEVGDRGRGVAARKRRHEPGGPARVGVVRLGGELHRRRQLRGQLGPPSGAAVDRERQGAWATGVEASLPANARTGPATGLVSVSCASAGNCTAVGNYDVRSGNFQGLLLTETSGTWATGVEAVPARKRRHEPGRPASSRCRAARRGTAPPSATTRTPQRTPPLVWVRTTVCC